MEIMSVSENPKVRLHEKMKSHKRRLSSCAGGVAQVAQKDLPAHVFARCACLCKVCSWALGWSTLLREARFYALLGENPRSSLVGFTCCPQARKWFWIEMDVKV
jgi:hypothetical protein